MKNKTQICRVSYLQSFTAKIFFTIFCCCLNQQVLAQLEDNFSDNDFSVGPPWAGDHPKFIINNERLQLNSPAEDGFAYLSTGSMLAVNGLWEFTVILNFNPSGSNYARIYLTSDQQDLTGPLNGYFVMIGGSTDEVSLYKQTGFSFLKIIDGTDDVVNLQSVEITIKVTRDENTGWQLFTRTTEPYTLQGTTVETAFLQSYYFGILCAYTATRSDKFFFDDFNVLDNSEVDTTLPVLENVEVITSRELKLSFSEPLSQPFTMGENFSVDNSVGRPIQVLFERENRIVNLIFEKEFPSHTRLLLSVSGVTDLANNLMLPIDRPFVFSPETPAYSKDLIISEIFADPAPTVGLPAFEFIEIFNRSDRPLNLLGWTLTDGSSRAILPGLILLPTQYCLLTSPTADFPNTEKVLFLENFPSLNNTNDALILADGTGNKIDSIQYFSTWYNDDDKAAGGWSLEIIDPDNICGEHENWTASENPTGGTPGYQNSVFANKPDLKGPKLESVVPLTATKAHLNFNEKLQKALPQARNINITPFIAVGNIFFTDGALTSLEVSFENELQSDITYTLTVSNVYDCAGNLAEQEFSNQQFGLPKKADSLDLRINEILFNPRPTGVDFVEIINTSSKFINLKDWSIASLQAGVLKHRSIATKKDFVLPPKEILVFTEDRQILKGEYLLSRDEKFFEVGDMPAFNDDEGTVALLDQEGRMIDLFSYTKDMHSIYLKDDEGVSLECISLGVSNSAENWKSGSATVGFATPGYSNSNTSAMSSLVTPVTVDPESFNPTSSNTNFALIHYNFEYGGYVANVNVFDSQGRLVKNISNNDILGTSGFYRWDGDRDDGSKANVGYYMIWFEIFDAQGSVKHFRNRVAIATSF